MEVVIYEGLGLDLLGQMDDLAIYDDWSSKPTRHKFKKKKKRKKNVAVLDTFEQSSRDNKRGGSEDERPSPYKRTSG